jgi:YD repeat-containing protein
VAEGKAVLRPALQDAVAGLLLLLSFAAERQRDGSSERDDKYGFEGTDASRRHGDLLEVNYNDGTPSSTNSYDRRGRLANVLRTNRTVSWTYNDSDRPLTETIAGGTLAGWSIVNEYNARLQRTHQRLREGGTTRQEARYGYDGAGRLQAMTNGLVAGLRAAYSYLPNSGLVGTLALTNNGTSRGLVTSREYDRLNRLRTISSKAYGTAAPGLPVAFDYQYNAANQRTRVNREDGAYWVYTYDDLGQVISGRKYWGDGTEVAGQQFDYALTRSATGRGPGVGRRRCRPTAATGSTSIRSGRCRAWWTCRGWPIRRPT